MLRMDLELRIVSFPKPVPPFVLRQKPAIDVLGQPHVLSTIFERSVPLSNTTRFHCAITLHHNQSKFRP